MRVSTLFPLLAIACGEPASEPSGRMPAPPVDVTDPAADCAASVVDVTVTDLPNPLAKGLDVTLDQPAGLWAVCRPADDPNEAILVESGTPATEHTLDVTGLYADAPWTCTVTPACADGTAATIELEASLPSAVPTFLATGTPSGPWTLLNTQQGFAAEGRRDVVIVDPDGRVRWQRQLEPLYAADIDAAWTGEVVHIGGGWGLFDESWSTRGVIEQVDLAGRVVYTRSEPVFGLGYNHHCEPLPDGEILSITGTYHEVGTRWNGIAIERLDPTTDTVTWSWSSDDLVAAGLEGPFPGQTNPWNANALAWTTDPAGEALWISLYTGQAMWRIDPGTGERTHVLGRDGDFRFVDPSGEDLAAGDLIYGQHGPEFTADGRVLVYDNGVDRPGGPQSRVAELQLDFDAGTATLRWQWTEEGWYTPIIGDADYLPSGHVLVTKGVVRALTPFRQQPSAVIEVDPATDEVQWRLEPAGRPTPAIYRSQQYSACAIFRSGRHCADVADRIAFLDRAG